MAHLCSAYLGKKKTFAQMAKAAKKRGQKSSRKNSEGDDFYGFLRPKSNRPPRVVITVKSDLEEKDETNELLHGNNMSGNETMESLLALEIASCRTASTSSLHLADSMHSGYSSMTVPSMQKGSQRSPRCIGDLEDLLDNANSLVPANIPMKVVTGYKPSTNWAAKDEVSIEQGMIVNALYKQNDWVMVRTPKQRSGFVPYTYVKPLCLTDGANLNHSREFERKPEVYDSITEALNTSPVEYPNGKMVYINDSERFLLDERKSGDGESVESNPSEKCDDPWSYEDSSDGTRSSIHEMPSEVWINEKLSSMNSVHKEKSEIIGLGTRDHLAKSTPIQNTVPSWKSVKTMDIQKLSPVPYATRTPTPDALNNSNVSQETIDRVLRLTSNPKSNGVLNKPSPPKMGHRKPTIVWDSQLKSGSNGVTLPGGKNKPKIMQKNSPSPKAASGYLLYLPELDEVKKTIEKLESLKLQSENQVSKSYEKLNNRSTHRQDKTPEPQERTPEPTDRTPEPQEGTPERHLYSGQDVVSMNARTRDPVMLQSNLSISHLGKDEAFPKNYNGYKMMVLYDYDAMHEDDVSVKRGDVVVVLNNEDEDWLFVQVVHGQEGFIPKAYAVVNSDSGTTCM